MKKILYIHTLEFELLMENPNFTKKKYVGTDFRCYFTTLSKLTFLLKHE